MQFPLSFWDLSLWLAVTALILLSAAELTTGHYGRNLLLNKRRMRLIALVLGTLFVITVMIRAIQVMIFF